MRPTDAVTTLWTTTVRTVLPQRGAVANARDAVLRDRWLAEQRREAAVCAARAAGHPSALPAEHAGAWPGGLDAPPAVPGQRGGAGSRPGRQLTPTERARFADVAPAPDGVSAAETALDLLVDLAPMDLWLVTAVHDDLEEVVAARGALGAPVRSGAVLPWADSYCRRMVAGEAPRAAPRVRDVPAYAASPLTRRWGVAAYLGVPLVAADGRLLGTVCGLACTERDASLHDVLPEVERVARLLSTVLAEEAVVVRRTREAARAGRLADRDPVTGLLDARGWRARLVVEEERRRRRGHAASVLVCRVGTGRPDAGSAPDDDALLRVARVLRLACRGSDVLGRLADRDLAVLAVDCDATEVSRLARRLRDAVEPLRVPVRLGVAGGVVHEDLVEAWRSAVAEVSAGAGGPAVPAPVEVPQPAGPPLP